MATKQIERIRARRKDFIERWMPQLTERLGRDPDALRGNGLECGDFPYAGVRITFADGSVLQFEDAFFVEKNDDGRSVAVFTEHCGYHEFELWQDDTVGPLR